MAVLLSVLAVLSARLYPGGPKRLSSGSGRQARRTEDYGRSYGAGYHGDRGGGQRRVVPFLSGRAFRRPSLRNRGADRAPCAGPVARRGARSLSCLDMDQCGGGPVVPFARPRERDRRAGRFADRGRGHLSRHAGRSVFRACPACPGGGGRSRGDYSGP